MPKQVINTSDAPKAVGPYSQAIKVDKFLFISGQIPINPKTGSLILGSIEAQTRRVMENIKALLAANSATMDNIVKTTIYLKKIDDYKFVNIVYEKYFEKDFPSRSTIVVSELPKRVDIEIDAIAVLD